MLFFSGFLQHLRITAETCGLRLRSERMWNYQKGCGVWDLLCLHCVLRSLRKDIRSISIDMDKWSVLEFCLMCFVLKLRWLTASKFISLKVYRQLDDPEFQCHVKRLDFFWLNSIKFHIFSVNWRNTKQRHASNQCSQGVYTLVDMLQIPRSTRQDFFSNTNQCNWNSHW